MSTNGNELSSLKAKIEQTRAAREAFLRGSTPSNSTSSNTSNVTSNSPLSTSTPMNSIYQPMMSSNQTHHSSQNKVTSIVRDNFSTNSNREIVTDKATLMASLNNTANSSSMNNSHLYQNIQHVSKTNSNSSNGSADLAKPHAPIAALNSNGVTANNASNQSPIKNSPVSVTAPAGTAANLSKQRNLDGYVGFANLPNQVYRKSVKKGFEFNLMVIGESGLGKSTFINSLFLTELYNPTDFPGTFDRKKKTTFVDATSVVLTEKGVNLRLTVVDTPGFGDSIDNTNCWLPITEYIDSKYEEYLNAESKVIRKLPISDQRIHCCLYFISPGHTLKQLDIEVMKKLHDRVNLIPVIAKADTMTTEEIKHFKSIVLNIINDHKLQIYEFPDIDDDDIEHNRNNSILKSKLPFAIVGSNTIIEADGKSFRGRQYPWGIVNIDEMGHCDFMALRTMLIRTHMQDLKDVTNNVHYENYRFKKLAYVAGDKAKPNNKNPFQQLEEEKRDAEMRLEKMKNEMEGVFDQKVKEKIARLRESELNLEKQQEAMKMSLEKEEKDLEEKRIMFLREKHQWEESNREDEEKLKQTLDKEDKKKKKIF